jgi:hypothetical protein
MALDLRSTFSYWQQLGLTDVILPFLIVFALLFGVLQKVAIFHEKKDNKVIPNKKINAIIALAIGLLVVIPHVTGGYPGGVDVVDLMNRFLPQSTFVVLVVVMVLLLLGVVGTHIPSPVTWLAGLAAVGALVFVVINAVSPYQLPLWLQFLDDPAFQALVILLLVFGLIVWFVTKPEGKKPGDKEYVAPLDAFAKWFQEKK